jgi:hypothetical protein
MELLPMHVPIAIAAHSYTVTHSAHKLISRCTQVTGDFLCAYALQHVQHRADIVGHSLRLRTTVARMR